MDRELNLLRDDSSGGTVNQLEFPGSSHGESELLFDGPMKVHKAVRRPAIEKSVEGRRYDRRSGDGNEKGIWR